MQSPRTTQLWQACGANVSEMSAENHDSIFAAISHLPHLLAFALVNDITSRPNAAQLFSFAASGFRDFTRIAGSHPEMWRDISLANKTALLNEITAYQDELSGLKQMLEHEDGWHCMLCLSAPAWRVTIGQNSKNNNLRLKNQKWNN